MSTPEANAAETLRHGVINHRDYSSEKLLKAIRSLGKNKTQIAAETLHHIVINTREYSDVEVTAAIKALGDISSGR